MATLRNENAYSLVSGGADNDYIENYGDTVTINAGAGNDSISNYDGSQVSIDGGAGNDSIDNQGDSVIINAGAGNDSVRNTGGQNVKIDAGDGDNYIYNDYTTEYNSSTQQYETLLPDKATIATGAGKDTIHNYGNKVSISAGAGDDSIRNWGDSVTINAGAGNDSISNDGSQVSINGGAGNDSIYNDGSQVSINGGTGNDSIDNYASDVTIDGGAGNDSISNSGASSTIDGGIGNDEIINWGDSVTINGGEGNDSIQNYGMVIWNSEKQRYEEISSDSTIDGDAGNDYISNGGNNVSISGGDGNDSIVNWGNEVLINAGAGHDSIDNQGDSVTIDASAGDDYIHNSGASSTIDGGIGNDEIINWGDSVTINGGAGDDSIYNWGRQSVKIYAGDGDNYIYNGYTTHYNSDTQQYETLLPDKATIVSGTGNDTIYNYGNKASISSGAGNDSIYNRGDSVTISTGAGDDSVYNYGENVLVKIGGGQNTVNGTATVNMGTSNATVTGDCETQTYQYVGGNDVITNYSYEDIIQIASGKLDSYSFDGGDLIFHIGKGSLRLKNMTNHAITVKDSSGKTTTKIYSNGYSPQQVIKNLVQAWSKTMLSGTTKLDESIKLCSQFNSIQEVIDKMVADCRAVGDADTFLRNYCGIITDNDDTGAITGWDAGGFSAKTSSDIVGETLSSLKHLSDYTDATFKTSQGTTINISSTGDSLTADGKKVFDALYSWWADETLKLIEESYGVKFTDNHKINFELVPDAYFWGQTSGTYVRINMGATSFYGDDDYNGDGVDRCIAHEFTHVAQNLFMGYFPQFLEEGLAELTHGIDDWRNFSQLASDADYLNKILDVNKGGTGDSVYYAAGFMFYRYLAKQISDAYDSLKSYAWKENSSIVGTSDAEFLTGSGQGVTISAGKGNDTITSYGEKMKVFGEDGDDTIGNKGAKATISGGAGNDSIHNWSSNVLITGGAGNDVIYTTGENVTLKGGAGKRPMSIGNGSGGDSGENATVNGGAGDDIIYSFGYYKHENNSLTVASKKKVLLIGGDGNDYIDNDYTENATLNGGNGNDTINNSSDKVSISAGADDDTISNSGSYVSIDAGASNDSIDNWSDSVTINAGAGNDSIRNTGGQNVKIDAGDGDNYIYNDYTTKYNSSTQQYETLLPDKATIVTGVGKDTIYNYGNKVSISSGASNDSIDNWGNEVLINAGAGHDSIDNQGDSVTIDAGVGNDSIDNYYGDNVTINGGAGKDTIHNYGNKVSISGGDGNDSIDSSGNSVIINAGAGDDNIYNWGGQSVKTYAGDGDNYIYNDYTTKYNSSTQQYETLLPDKATIVSGAGVDSISNYGNKTSINSGAGNDSIDNHGSSITIDAGTDNDIIINGGYWESDRGGHFVTINGGSGNDTLISHGSTSKLNGSDGNDSIANGYRYYAPWNAFYDSDSDDYKGNNSTIGGGTGNDTIKNRGNKVLFQYKSGDGNDFIEGFNATSTLSISGGEYSSTKSNDNIIFTVGKGKVTLSGAATLSKVNIIGTPVTLLSINDKTKSPVTAGSTIKFIDASARTTPVKITGNALANTLLGGSRDCGQNMIKYISGEVEWHMN